MVKINNNGTFDISEEVRELNIFTKKIEKDIKKGVKFLKKGLKVNGKYFSVWYSKGNYTKESGIPEGSITIYNKNYTHFPIIVGLNIQNESDMMTDYFEKDRIVVRPDSIWYSDIVRFTE